MQSAVVLLLICYGRYKRSVGITFRKRRQYWQQKCRHFKSWSSIFIKCKKISDLIICADITVVDFGTDSDFWGIKWDQILPIRKADVQHELATFIRAVSMSFNCGFPYKQVVTFRMSDAPLNPGRRYFLIVRSCFRSLFAAKNLHLIWSAQFGAVFSAWWLIMRLGCWWVPAQSPYQRLLRGYWVCCSYFKATC